MQNQDFNSKKPVETDQKNTSSMSQYGRYSSIVFQMLATMALSFWGGKKLNNYFEIQSNLLTVGIGLLGMCLAFYNLLRQLNQIEKNEK
ncbi:MULTISPECIES: AtpZ/AtpI family protein [Amniculibacterium]|jgi:F0F1-type ATP synthase assembly protein I|uniref:AtpZ/AtpI family protein n=1 Tax=Amniculibacterium TaxID=2715289 RepID=UPI000F5B2A49|nr:MULTISPECIES: AtpZ/AtpI family protein [Amniculibacterium]